MPRKKSRRGRGEGACFWSESKQAWIARLPIGRLPSGKVRYKEVQAPSKAEVLDRLRRVEEERRGGFSKSSKLTVGQYLTHWLEDTVKPRAQSRTYESYETNVRVHLIPAFGHLLLDELEPRQVEAFYAQLTRDGASPSLVRKAGQVLGVALRHATRMGLLQRSATDLVRRPRESRREPEPFTAQEVRRILGVLPGRPNAALFALALATGARMGELLALAWHHLDLDAGTMRVERSLSLLRGGERRLKETKSAQGRRTVSLPAFAVEALRRHREGASPPRPVFSTRSGGFLERTSVRRSWWRILRRAGVPYRRFHCTRHTHASQLLALGVSLVEVARRLGDRPETVLRAYAAYLPGDARVPERLQELYAQSGVGVEDAPSRP